MYLELTEAQIQMEEQTNPFTARDRIIETFPDSQREGH